MLSKFGIDKFAKSITTPLASCFKLSSQSYSCTNEEREFVAQVQNTSAVGSLIYAIVCTRPNLRPSTWQVGTFLVKNIAKW